MTWIPLSEALQNMLLYVEDHRREKKAQDFDRLKTAVVQAAAKSAFVAPENGEEQWHTVCVAASLNRNTRGLAHCIAHFFSL